MATAREETTGNDVSPSKDNEVGGTVRADRPAPGQAAGDEWRSSLKHQLHQQLLATIASGRDQRLNEQDLRRKLARLAEELSRQQSVLLESTEQDTLIEQVLDEVFGFGPLEGLIRDNAVSDIMINGPRQVFVEKRGQVQATDISFRDEAHLLDVLGRMVATTGRRLDEKSPMLDARLPDGSRLNAVLTPPALNGPLVSIRRFGLRPLAAEDLLVNESLTPEMLEFLAACVKARINIIIAGGTGSGKTSLLNALSRYIPNSERLVTIEDTPEMELQQVNVAKMEAQPGDPQGEGQITTRDLIKNALRMRPDRIIVGECRGAEALEMLQAMNTGHEGSLTTIHSNSPRDTLARIELMISLAGVDIPVWAVRKLIAASVNMVIQVARLPGGPRKVTAISEITGMEGDMISMHDLFDFVQTGVDNDNVVQGYFRATGIRPKCLHRLSVRGANLPVQFFAERKLQPQKKRSQADGIKQ
jgi:pilus assembly protein CpaF